MATQCHNQLTLGFQPKIVLDFNGGEITSDSGLLLLRQFDAQLALTQRLTGLFNDRRNALFIEHHTHEMLCQRIYQIAAGYEDCNDADALRCDPTFQTIVGKSDPLASQPTLSRLENQADEPTIERLGAVGLQWFLQHGYKKREAPKEILLDSDATDDPCHGQQEFAFFHGKYGQHMYHPLFFFEAKTGSVLSAQLRPGNASASAGIAAELERLVPILKQRFPNSQISYRADAGSATPEIYRTLESFEMLYAIGIASNSDSRKEPQAGLRRQRASMPAPKCRSEFSIAFATGPEAGTNNAGSWSRSKLVLWEPMSALSSPTARVEPKISMTAMMSEESARIGSRNLSAILALTGFPAIAPAPMPFVLNSMRSLTNCWCCSVCTRFEPPISLALDWKPYGLSCSKWELGFSVPLATCGFISPQAGPDAICWWKCGKNLATSSSLHPVKPRSQNNNRPGSKSQQTSAGVCSKNAFLHHSITKSATSVRDLLPNSTFDNRIKSA